jgi:LPXTG-motif cell wall-anchored protein
MHGTIVVLGAAATTPAQSSTTAAVTASTGPSSTTSTSAAGTSGPSGPTLPNTGFDVLTGVLAGVLLLGVGIVLRRTLAACGHGRSH